MSAHLGPPSVLHISPVRCTLLNPPYCSTCPLTWALLQYSIYLLSGAPSLTLLIVRRVRSPGPSFSTPNISWILQPFTPPSHTSPFRAPSLLPLPPTSAVWPAAWTLYGSSAHSVPPHRHTALAGRAEARIHRLVFSVGISIQIRYRYRPRSTVGRRSSSASTPACLAFVNSCIHASARSQRHYQKGKPCCSLVAPRAPLLALRSRAS